MANFSTSVVVLFLFLFVSLPHFNNASVLDACKAAAASSPNVNYNFCVASLQADPQSASANPAGLAKIATKLTSNSAKGTKDKIKTMLNDAAYGDIGPQLSTCRSLYSGMVDNLSRASNAIGPNKATARTFLSAALGKPGNCEDAFKDKQATSVLSTENANAKQLAAIALALVNMS